MYFAVSLSSSRLNCCLHYRVTKTLNGILFLEHAKGSSCEGCHFRLQKAHEICDVLAGENGRW